jgi:protocatechuate 3,4-dioxygenase beta subunit
MLRGSIFLIAMLVLASCTGPSGSGSPPALKSGLQKGDDIESWNPIHVAGPNKGTNACPVCTYLARPAIVIFTKDGPNVPALATRLQDLVVPQQKHQLKAFVIVLDSTPEHLKQMADDLKITQIGICYLDPATRDHDLQLYKINLAATNTVMVYKDYKVLANFVNLDAADFDQVAAVVENLK